MLDVVSVAYFRGARRRATAHHEAGRDVACLAQQKRANWWCGFADMCACNCSGYKSDAGTQPAITVFQSAGRILSTLLLSLARK